MHGVGQDFRYALRGLRRSAGLSLVIVLTLAVGIGANTAIFSVIDAVILKSLPVKEPHELVYLRDPSFSYPIFQRVRERRDLFSGVFGWTGEEFLVEWNGEVQKVPGLLATEEFHTTLGVNALLGRTFKPEDADSPVAVISHSYWKQRLGGDPGVIGKTIHVERVPLTVVGVTPPDFFGVAPGMRAEVTIPARIWPRLRPEDRMVLTQPTNAWLHIMARLRPGLSREQADAAFQVIWPRILEEVTPRDLPADRRGRYLARASGLESALRGFSRVRNAFQPSLRLLMAAAVMVLLVTCANIANLLLARGTARRKEMAVRVAYGAGRGRIARQLLAESLLLAVLGGAAGLVFAFWGTEALLRLLSSNRLAIVVEVQPDWRVLGFTGALAALTAVLFGLAPALRATRVDVGPALRESARSLAGGRSRWRLGRALVVVQVALSLPLLIGAGLLAGSLRNLLTTNPGFQHENVLLVSVDALVVGYRGPRLAALYDELQRRIERIPQVRSLSLSWVPPISLGAWTQWVAVEGAGAESQEPTYFNAISPRFFETMGALLVRGRDFAPQDREGAPRVAIVNQAFARHYFGARDPIGRRISVGRHPARQDLTIVGLAPDMKYQRLQEPVRRIVYLPYRQLPEFLDGSNLMFEIRSAGPPAELAGAIRREFRTVDTRIPLDFETLSNRVSESVAKERGIAAIASFFSLLALALASLGLYGITANSIERRTNEIGIRMALGARAGEVLRMFLRETAILLAAGATIGLPVALVSSRLIAAFLFGVTPTDAATVALATAVTVVAGMLAGYLPARRAAKVDPMEALRYE